MIINHKGNLSGHVAFFCQRCWYKAAGPEGALKYTCDLVQSTIHSAFGHMCLNQCFSAFQECTTPHEGSTCKKKLKMPL